MKIRAFADATCLGDTQAEMIDASMGVIGGQLNPSAAYIQHFQQFFRQHLQKNDWKELEILGLRAVGDAGEAIEVLGGICIEDLPGFEIEVQVCGMKHEIIATVSQSQ